MARLFLLGLGVVLLLMLAQRLKSAEKSLLLKTIKWTVAGVLLLSTIYLTLVGKLLHVAALVLLLVLLFKTDAQSWLKHKRKTRFLSPPLTLQEARRLLGVKTRATAEEIERAFERVQERDPARRDRLLQARNLLLQNRGASKHQK